MHVYNVLRAVNIMATDGAMMGYEYVYRLRAHAR